MRRSNLLFDESTRSSAFHASCNQHVDRKATFTVDTTTTAVRFSTQGSRSLRLYHYGRWHAPVHLDARSSRTVLAHLRAARNKRQMYAIITKDD